MLNHGHPKFVVPAPPLSLPELLTRFTMLCPCQPEPEHPYSDATPLKPAAVLIPIIARGDELSVLLTRRSRQLRHHPGQISFPGGRQDPEDPDLAATALRETREELGIPACCIQLLGLLPEHITVSHYCMVPYLGLLQPDYPLQPAVDEVEEAFELPLAPLLDPANYGSWTITRHQRPHSIYGITLHDRLIWGATARILRLFARQMKTNILENDCLRAAQQN